MDMLRISLVGIGAAIIALTLRAAKRADIAAVVALAAGVVVLVFAVGKLAGVVGALEELATRGKVDGAYFAAVLRIVGVATLVEFGAQACRDCGEDGLAQKVEFGGKIAILALAVPILSALMDVVLELLP